MKLNNKGFSLIELSIVLISRVCINNIINNGISNCSCKNVWWLFKRYCH